MLKLYQKIRSKGDSYMFKKLVVGALATGMVLTGGMGASAAALDNTNTIPIAQESKSVKLLSSTNNEYGFTYTYDANRGVYKTYDFYSSTGNFANTFTSEGIRWHFKGVVEELPWGAKYGHYEGVYVGR